MEFLDKGTGCNDCISVDLLDELPVYQDTISFEEHISESRKPLLKYHDKGRSVVSAVIDTLGKLSHIRILDDNAHCEECLENVYEILRTAKSFIPGRKDEPANRYHSSIETQTKQNMRRKGFECLKIRNL